MLTIEHGLNNLVCTCLVQYSPATSFLVCIQTLLDLNFCVQRIFPLSHFVSTLWSKPVKTCPCFISACMFSNNSGFAVIAVLCYIATLSQPHQQQLNIL